MGMYIIKKLLLVLVACVVFATPSVAHANLIDAFNLAPFVPIVLDSLMMVATGVYEYFVGNGDGVIYIMIWIVLAMTLVIGLTKMYIPKDWLGFLGIGGGGEMWDGKITGSQIVQNIMRPGFRAVLAALFLLQIKPVFMTQWLINPFLKLGAVYTHEITRTINAAGIAAPDVECPPDIVAKAWIDEDSCKFMTQPVSDLAYANNSIIKRGFNFITTGLRGLLSLIPHGGEDFLNLVTGLLLVFTFAASNLFMSLLVIQGIFNFGMQLVLYPFYVLTYVIKPSDKWFDVWPVFGGITKALQQLIVTMIACAFILCINLAVVKALFQWQTSVFVVAAGGSASSNVPLPGAGTSGFGEHSIMWLSSILTFYLMFKIFDMTQKQLKKYVGSGMDGLHTQVVSDGKILWGRAKDIGSKVGTAIGWIKKK
jgi:hypothetical protein